MRLGEPRYEQGKTRRILLWLPMLGAGQATLPSGKARKSW